jgi:hypothetical protein
MEKSKENFMQSEQMGTQSIDPYETMNERDYVTLRTNIAPETVDHFEMKILRTEIGDRTNYHLKIQSAKNAWSTVWIQLDEQTEIKDCGDRFYVISRDRVKIDLGKLYFTVHIY